jgi:hypothetical protein
MHFTHTSAMDAEILCEAVDTPPIHSPMAGDNTIPECMMKKHAVIGRAMSDKGIDFDE